MKMIYKYSREEAQRSGELDLYRESRKENIACRYAVQEAINKYHQNNILDDAEAKSVIAAFGFNRTMWVLAASICYHSQDGRFSPENKKWARSVIPSALTDKEIGDYAADSHPALLNGFIDQVRREYAKLGLLSGKHCLKDSGTMEYTNKLLVLRPQILKDQYKNPICQLFFAESGFGCYPDKIGSKVFGRFLCDGERAQFWRNDFEGIADYKYVPDWAMTRLHDLVDPKMKIRIFQLKDDSDNKFMDHEFTVKHGGVKAENYHQIWGGTMVAAGIEDVFTCCNTDQFPLGYDGHSLSVSDIIQVCSGKDEGFYFCDSFGFKKLEDFDISKTDHSEMMKILVLENDRPPYPAEIIGKGIQAMQSVVGGNFEPVYFEPKGDAVCWCNDEFLLNGSAPNREIGSTIIHGTCFISGDGWTEEGERDHTSLTDKQIKLYTKMFPQSVICLADMLTETQEMTEEQSEDIGLTMTE